jgi:hypothetical protein
MSQRAVVSVEGFSSYALCTNITWVTSAKAILRISERSFAGLRSVCFLGLHAR